MVDIKQLYNKLYENPATLTKDDVSLLATDFRKRQTMRIERENAGCYLIKRTCSEFVLNGYLKMSSNVPDYHSFHIFIDQPETIQLLDNEEVILVNCTFEKQLSQKEDGTKAQEPSNSVETTINTLERLQNLHDSGTLTDEEFNTLKESLLNS